MFLLVFILMLVTQHALGVEVIEGAESVVLPCEAPPGAATSVTWRREDLKPSTVHQRIKIDQQPEKDVLTNQNQLFTDRTEVQPDALTTGHVNLTLKHIQLKDNGTYICIVLGGEGERLTDTQVQLQVISKEEAELRKQQEEQARRQRDTLIAVGIIIFIILCIVAAVLRWLYRSGYIWQKVQQVVVVDSGVESVLLRCRTIRLLPKDVRVKWTAGDRMVHESLTGSDQPGEQDDLYKGRTEMKRNLRILVDLSLTLKHPTDRDNETYTCTVYSREGDVLMRRQVELEVKVPEVEVDSGVESVLLPCEATVQLPEDVRVQWTDGDMKKLHVSLKGSDQPGEQDYLYRGRTEMTRKRPGDLSLTLKHPTGRDRDTYTCTVYSREGDVLMVRQVLLWVKGLSVPQVVDSGEESVLLPCKATGQLPEDVRVEWTDGDNLVQVSLKGSDQPEEQDELYRGRTEMKRDLQRPGDLSLTLKHPTGRDSKTYTCTVYSREGDVLMVRHVRLEVKVQQVGVEQGAESVLLPFKTTENLPEDVRVTWRRLDPVKTVHVFEDGSDQQDRQDPSHRGRTERKGDLRQGDVSLILKHPTERDTGRYSCSVYSKDIRRETTVYLYVTVCKVEVKKEEPVQQPEVPELKSTHEGYQLVNMDPAESC